MKRVLDPVDRASEIVFGLLMALSFTGSLSVASAGREEVRTMMAAALGCNLAWGLADAVMYLVGIVVERARAAKLAGAPAARGHRLLGRDDYSGALGVFLMVVLATFPVVIPFAVFDDTARALRISNLVALGHAVRGRLDARALRGPQRLARGHRHGRARRRARRRDHGPGRLASEDGLN